MKKTLIIVAHPSLRKKSVINSAWCNALSGHESITIRDLYAEYPDGKINIAKEQALVEAHERIIFQFPLWWYAAPALLKVWLDEVLTEGWAYGAGGDKMLPKEIGAAVSCGGKITDFQEGAAQRHTLAHYLDVFDGVAAFTRCKYIGFHAVYDTYNPETVAHIDENCRDYLSFLEH
ncbi:NAD(P)H-dependent oxidoreductase [Porphyromonas crevioricanis]|uniref:NADPH dehydrogenase n=1 Tax=Porphyromonas crevioricanis TaxID=393921 RepID=A0AB34PFQ7_9PORP|nr:NAD(P)H-dependent oxidoreductase [Porphyromonas crevioricanis]KGN94640.1 NADPH dehydrogenase [Porphyromonas crevioricanis]